MDSHLSPAAQYIECVLRRRKENRWKWKSDAAKLISAHELALSALVLLTNRNAGRHVEGPSDSVQGRVSLIAQFMQAIEIIEGAIAEGLYSQAAALLKQEMETIESIREYEEGSRIERKTPQIKLLERLGVIYGHFNRFAHVSVTNVAKNLVYAEEEDYKGASALPLYHRDLARGQYGIHVFLITIIFNQVHKLYKEIYGSGADEFEISLQEGALTILVEENIIVEREK